LLNLCVKIYTGEKMFSKLGIYLYVFLIGATLYSTIEVVFRGYTHWTMTLTGGVIFTLIYLMNKYIKTRSLTIRCLISCSIITAIEFVVGVIVNIIFKMNVWDYSNQPLNLFGQICLVFTAAWFIISVPACYLAIFIKEKLDP